MRLHDLLNSFSAVGAGQTATTSVPNARRIHALFLFTASGDTAAELDYQIRAVRLKLGGTELIDLTIPQLIALNAYHGIPFANGELGLYFSKPEARTPTGEEATGLNAFVITEDLTLEVEYRSNAEYAALKGGGATVFVPTLSGLIEHDPVNDGNRAFVKQVPATIQNAAAGDVDFNTLPREGAYKAIHLFTTLVNRVRVKRGGLEILDRNTRAVAAIGRRNSLTPQTGHFPIDFAFTNQATDALEMLVPDGKGGKTPVNTFNVKLTTTAGGNITAIIEQVVIL